MARDNGAERERGLTVEPESGTVFLYLRGIPASRGHPRGAHFTRPLAVCPLDRHDALTDLLEVRGARRQRVRGRQSYCRERYDSRLLMPFLLLPAPEQM